ncbi:hypothetical protein VTJ83DRAFT_4734 [Remersonia thermophila]|uniref:Zn(2)-C6 fungal-type domain-containing protein n=1 Tax=Remersonia thermophila TaxID=72144 RepID=A0ABR4DAS0_9PEZI
MIRRVKCDEGKPACNRCTSTGRTCDGYDKAALTRYQSPGPSQAAEVAKAEFVRACEWNETLRSMRRIEADIDGTETEKRVFSRFKAAMLDGADAQGCAFGSFWRRLTPTTACQDEAVKHAVVAMAASCLLFRDPQASVVEGFSRPDLEVFTIQQYNRSIEHLQGHATSSSFESIRLTLICCLAFISLETLRGNPAVAVSHLTNGLRILQSLPDSTFNCVADGSVFAWPSGRDSLDMPDIVQLFARLEASACFFTHGIQPVISERAYRPRRLDDGSAEGPFSSLAHARMAITCFKHDVVARLHQVAVATAGGPDQAALFWSNPIQQQQQACLQSRSTRLGTLTADFFSPTRFGTPDSTPPDLLWVYLDLLYFRCAQFLIGRVSVPGIHAIPTAVLASPNPSFSSASPATLNPYAPSPSLPYPYTATTASHPVPGPDLGLLQSILNLAARLTARPVPNAAYLSYAPASPSRAPPDMTTRVIGPLYLVAVHASDPGTQAAATRLLADCIHRHERQTSVAGGGVSGKEGHDPGGWMRQTFTLVERAVKGERERMRKCGLLLSTEIPRALAGVGCLPSLWDALTGVVAGTACP